MRPSALSTLQSLVGASLFIILLNGCGEIERAVDSDAESDSPAPRSALQGEADRGDPEVALDLTVPALPTSPDVSLPDSSNPKASPPLSLTGITPGHQSFGYWLNGYRKQAEDDSADVLCFETGFFGFALDINSLGKARFGRFEQGPDYRKALDAGVSRMQSLDAAELAIEIRGGSRVFRAMRATTGKAGARRRLQGIRLWESGQLVQHFDLQNLVFEDASGNQLGCDATLNVVTWPESVTLTASLTPGVLYKDGPHLGAVGNGLCIIEKPLSIGHQPGLDPAQITVECWVKVPESLSTSGRKYIIGKNRHEDVDGFYAILLNRGKMSAAMNVGGGSDNLHSVNERGHWFKLDEWNHLAMTYDGNVLRFYINGQPQGESTVGAPRTPAKDAMIVGQQPTGRGAVMSGVIDEIRVWNRPLSPEEIKQHAAQQIHIQQRDGLTFEQSFDGPGSESVREPVWTNVTTSIRLKSAHGTWEEVKQHAGKWPEGESRDTTLTCDVSSSPALQAATSVTVDNPFSEPQTAAFSPTFNSYVAEIGRLNRPWKGGYTDIRDYDEFEITVTSDGAESRLTPFLLYLRHPANITGLCPILCYEDGRPTGVHVQLSKNWHNEVLGAYLRAYALLPTPPGTTTYKLRIPYGFYGNLPSASHAQLSLIGYGGNGRWDQLAIGCWGETQCLDMDMSCVDVAITDVRMLMARAGKDGQMWGWTEAGWGGDWLGAKDAQNHKLAFKQLKTAYFAHGPCLSDVGYKGYYGADNAVDLQATVRTLRTDDYARTFHTLRYGFEKQLDAEGAWLFKMGRTANYHTPRLAYGNASGLIEQHQVPTDLKQGDLYLDRITLQGEGPWWVTFPQAAPLNSGGKATGYRALVIRAYSASFGGKVYSTPTISAPVFQILEGGVANIDLLLTAPKGVGAFMPGDSVEMDLEWITLHREAADYYGPNETYRAHLEAEANSWQTTYREAVGNDLNVQIRGGTILNTYPLIIRSEAKEVVFKISGGVGAVPVRFENLTTATGFTLYRIDGETLRPLEQAVHGNDFWQTDYDPASATYKVTFNLPLDELDVSTWVLRTGE